MEGKFDVDLVCCALADLLTEQYGKKIEVRIQEKPLPNESGKNIVIRDAH